MMGPIYSYQCYKAYVNDLIKNQKNGGRGTYSKIAKYLGVSNVLVSQVLNGDRNFVRDKAFNLCQFFNLNEMETEYFLCLYEENLTNGNKHREYLMSRLSRLKDELVQMKLDEKEVVAREYQKIYYSSWLYPAVRLCLIKKDINTLDDVSRYLGQSPSIIEPVLNFLVKADLVRTNGAGEYEVSEKTFMLPKDSEFIMNHHMNLKNLEINRIIEGVDEQEVCYSSLVVTSRKVIEEQIEKMRETISESCRAFSKGESEDLVLFNLSLLKLAVNE